MRIGVISDTHNRLPNVTRIVALLNEAGVDRVVHTGDITTAKTLEVLAGLEAPLFGVYGNNDVERASLDEAARRFGMHFAEAPLRLSWADRQLVVVPDPRDLESQGDADWDIALHGHTHLRSEVRTGGRLVFNPGECAGHLKGHNAIGLVDLPTLETEILLF